MKNEKLQKTKLPINFPKKKTKKLLYLAENQLDAERVKILGSDFNERKLFNFVKDIGILKKKKKKKKKIFFFFFFFFFLLFAGTYGIISSYLILTRIIFFSNSFHYFLKQFLVVPVALVVATPENHQSINPLGGVISLLGPESLTYLRTFFVRTQKNGHRLQSLSHLRCLSKIHLRKFLSICQTYLTHFSPLPDVKTYHVKSCCTL